ncbi:MAG: hypothetical protein ACR2JE_08150 [Acidobacteriaceae bacterium]
MTIPARSRNATALAPTEAKAARARTLFRRQVAGLLILAAVVLAVCLLRANPHDVFPPGWWRVW